MPEFLKKVIGRVGDSLGIIFSKRDITVLGLEVGDVIDLADAVIIKKRAKKNKK